MRKRLYEKNEQSSIHFSNAQNYYHFVTIFLITNIHFNIVKEYFGKEKIYLKNFIW